MPIVLYNLYLFLILYINKIIFINYLNNLLILYLIYLSANINTYFRFILIFLNNLRLYLYFIKFFNIIKINILESEFILSGLSIMKKIIYTIGYTSFQIDDFIDILKNNNISCLIDVRSSPYSHFYPNYNKGQLDLVLKNNNILYRNYITEFGARQHNNIYYHQDGYLDFNKFILSTQFLEGVSKIKKGIQLGYTFCLMCAEANPINCHRSIMVSRGLKNNGFQVFHFLKGGTLLSHSDLEQNLLDIHFKDKRQLSLFSNYSINPNIKAIDNQLITEAYDNQNKIIGFRKHKNNI